MSFTARFFGKKEKASAVVLIDIGSNSLAGAHLYHPSGTIPKIIYAKRVPIIAHAKEERSAAMLRAFGVLGEALIREGAPANARASGRGTVSEVLISIDAPWEETLIHVGKIERAEPFIITHTLVDETTKAMEPIPTGKLVVDKSILGTILNGYEIENPYGKRAQRATIITFESRIDMSLLRNIDAALERLYHFFDAFHFKHIAGTSARYQAIRAIFPIERNAIVIDATSQIIKLLLERNGLLVAVEECPCDTKKTIALCSDIERSLRELAKHFPLPHTIFLIAHSTDIDGYKELLGKVNFGALWLSDSPPKIIPVLVKYLSTFITSMVENADVSLMLLGLYYARQYAPQNITMHL